MSCICNTLLKSYSSFGIKTLLLLFTDIYTRPTNMHRIKTNKKHLKHWSNFWPTVFWAKKLAKTKTRRQCAIHGAITLQTQIYGLCQFYQPVVRGLVGPRVSDRKKKQKKNKELPCVVIDNSNSKRHSQATCLFSFKTFMS